jgi:hypothetical protein
MLAATHGVAGQAGVTVLCLLYAPNIAGWGAAYLLGPGFAVGLDTTVSPGAVLIGPLPGLPVLAGLPSVPLSGIGPVLLGVPVLAGICAGVLLARRRSPAMARRGAGGRWGPLVLTAALSGPVAGLLLQAFAFASAGGIGSGRLSVLGPTGWRVLLFATLVLTVGSVIGAAGSQATGGQGRGHPVDTRARSRDPLPGDADSRASS